MPTVPRTIAELTTDWLTTTLQQSHPDAAVSKAAIAPLHGAASYNGQILLAQLSGTADAGKIPDTLIAKLVPTNGQMLQLGASLGVYLREAYLYREIGARTGVRMAGFLGAAEDVPAGLSAILLEDLSHLQVGNQFAGFSLSQAERTVTQYARLHARWWNSAELDSYAWLPVWNEPALVEFATAAYTQIWPVCAERFAVILPAEARLLGDRLAALLPQFMNAAAAAPFTLLHGDARHDNLIFDPAHETEPPFVIDWQFTARGRGTLDIAYYLTQSGDTEVTAAHERTLVERYHAELLEHGVRDYDFAQCWEDYRRFAYYTLVYPVLAAGLTNPDDKHLVAGATVILGRAVESILRLNADEFA